MSANSHPRKFSGIRLVPQSVDVSRGLPLNVQQVLSHWYHILKGKEMAPLELFPGMSEETVNKSLKTDLELIPGLLMDELVNDKSILDKGQYLRLVQALLVNTSDLLFSKPGGFSGLCREIENLLQFMQDFFYQQFDFEYRVSLYSVKEFKTTFQLKLDYWKIKLQQSPLADKLQECVDEKMLLPETYLTFRKINYLQNLFHQLESATSVITEEYVRELCIYSNFNAGCFIEYETLQIKNKINEQNSTNENIAILRQEHERIAQLKVKTNICFEINEPSVKKQLTDWVTGEIKHIELKSLKKADGDLLIAPDAKIQTSLSVAKLALLIRLLVVDKVIINKSVAPMLRTVAKLFTTLQKDEISFGSLETKYHAPDKATLNIMKEMMQKWAGLTAKL